METYSSYYNIATLELRSNVNIEETPNFLITVNPNDFALITALYRSSIHGRKFMYEAILSEDGNYTIPDNFTSRTAEILQVYLKSLGVRMETVIDDDNYIGLPEDDTVINYNIDQHIILCTRNEMYYLKKISKMYKKLMKNKLNLIQDTDDVWELIMENLPFKKKYLTDNIIRIFNENMEVFIG